MCKTPSLTYQIYSAFDNNLDIGSSRHEAKDVLRQEGRDPRAMGAKIHSWGTYKTEMKNAITVFKAVKEKYGSRVKWLKEVTPAMIEVIFAEYRTAELSANTLVARKTALHRLELITGLTFVPPSLVTSSQFSPHGAYTPDEAEGIIKALVVAHHPNSALVVQLQAAAGLRLREAVCLRNELIRDRQAGLDRLGVNVQTGTVFVEGKGGRQREVKLLEPAVLGGLDLDKRYPLRTPQTEETQMRKIQQQLRTACRRLGIQPRGTHGLRAMAARKFLAERLALGVDEHQAELELAHWLGHNRVDVLRHYLQHR